VLEKHGGKEAFVDAVIQEIAGRFAEIRGKNPDQFTNATIETLYVGGGTPSLLAASDYQRIFEALRQQLPFSETAEITLEANPSEVSLSTQGKLKPPSKPEARHPRESGDPLRQETDQSLQYQSSLLSMDSRFRGNDVISNNVHTAMASPVQDYLKAGFNRISVGVQSLIDTELKKLSRVHSAREAEAFIRHLQASGWQNISLDLMYGLPMQSMASWQETLERACALNVQHISMYGLKVEEGTPLERLSQIPGDPGHYAVPEDDLAVDMYFAGLKRLRKAGFERYEISNLGKPGYESRHNMNYWQQGEWLALGPSAHGYLNSEHIHNVRDLSRYLANPMAEDDRLPCSRQEQLENTLIFGLRTVKGVHIPSLEKDFGIDFRHKYAHVLKKFEGDYLAWTGTNQEWLVIPEKSVPVAHTVLAEFLD